jgi:GntR family transcriptional regulator, N-acetylglucosamine utilization regulator
MSEKKAPAVVELGPDDAVNLASAIPYYLQLAQHIEKKVKAGEWKTGWKVPGEMALCEHFHVSRTVIRQALDTVSKAGLINTYKGKGSFITQPKMAWELMQSLSGSYDDAVARGQQVNTRVLELSEIEADQEISQALQISMGEPVIKLHRLRFLDGEAVMVVISYIPLKICPSLLQEDFTSHSLYKLLREKYGLVITDGRRTIESVNAPHALAELLGVAAGAALSKITSVGYLSSGIALEYFIAWHRGDRSRFLVRLTTKAGF